MQQGNLIMAKLGFLIVLLLFGCSLFLAGVMAPSNIAEPAKKIATDIYTRWAPKLEEVDKEVTLETPVAIEYSSLLKVNKKTSPLGIQIGLFTSVSQVDVLKNELKQLKISAQAIAVTMNQGINWTLLAAGPYNSIEDVHLATAQLREHFGYSLGLDVLAWPALEKAH
jgi:cell division protein FtsN